MKILVIGDSCTDAFIYGSTPRLSPEGPAPVFLPEGNTTNPGMAANVERNLQSLGIETELITNSENITKTRYVDKPSNSLLLRVDENDKVDRIPKHILKGIKFNEYTSIIVSDYNKGFLEEEDIEYIASNHTSVVCDTKKQLGEWCKELRFVKLNRSEFKANSTYINDNEWITPKLLITLDKDGCMYNDVLFTTNKVEIMDISGAGDTFVAAFTYYLTNRSTVEESILFANKASSKVVQKRGVSTL